MSDSTHPNVVFRVISYWSDGKSLVPDDVRTQYPLQSLHKHRPQAKDVCYQYEFVDDTVSWETKERQSRESLQCRECFKTNIPYTYIDKRKTA